MLSGTIFVIAFALWIASGYWAFRLLDELEMAQDVPYGWSLTLEMGRRGMFLTTMIFGPIVLFRIFFSGEFEIKWGKRPPKPEAN